MSKNLRLEGTETDVASCAASHTPPDPEAESNPREEGWHVAEVVQDTVAMGWSDSLFSST